MRTSHRQIRKRILDAKSKITDEEFFSSRAYCGYLTDLAEAATKRYLKTKFVRFLVAQIAVSQHITKGCFAFVPTQDFSKAWSDGDLYKKYNLSEEEIDFIETMIRPMDNPGGEK